jgi:hypothetical protein
MDVDPTQPVCYVTTRGRVSGRRHTIEIWYVEVDASIFLLSGYGDQADWVKNMLASAEVTVSVAPDGSQGERSTPTDYVATVGPFAEEMHIRQAVEARYRGWRPGQPLSSWAAESLLVRLRPKGGLV